MDFFPSLLWSCLLFLSKIIPFFLYQSNLLRLKDLLMTVSDYPSANLSFFFHFQSIILYSIFPVDFLLLLSFWRNLFAIFKLFFLLLSFSFTCYFHFLTNQLYPSFLFLYFPLLKIGCSLSFAS